MTALPDELATPEYRALLRERYTRKGWGASGKSHSVTISKLCTDVRAKTVLDYGCGRGTLKPALSLHLDVREYDPGIVGKDTLPEAADVVVCTDVLEHIEPELLPNVMHHLRALMMRAGFFVIQQNQSFWFDHLISANFHVSRMERVKGLWVWVT